MPPTGEFDNAGSRSQPADKTIRSSGSQFEVPVNHHFDLNVVNVLDFSSEAKPPISRSLDTTTPDSDGTTASILCVMIVRVREKLGQRQ
jgi:hypothetical protein